MNKNDWVRKLTSRKFWAAVTGFITALLIASGATDGTITQVTAVVMAGASLIAYIIGEGLIDAARARGGAEEDDKTEGGKDK